MTLFMGFVFISGVGWILDVGSYAGLSQIFEMPPLFASFVSAMIGVTYVWIIALNRLFERGKYSWSMHLYIYWSYQVASIVAYAAFESIVATSQVNLEIGKILAVEPTLVAKLIITSPNLLTNFIFMSFLTKLMCSDSN